MAQWGASAGSPPPHSFAKDSVSVSLGISFSCHVLAEVFQGKEYHLATSTRTSLLLFLSRESSVTGAKGQGQHLGFKELPRPGLVTFCGNGCSKRRLLGEIALSRLWEEDNYRKPWNQPTSQMAWLGEVLTVLTSLGIWRQRLRA